MNTQYVSRKGKKKRTINISWGGFIQLAGVVVVSSGLTYEIIYKAALGFILITLGSLIFAIGTKIRGK